MFQAITGFLGRHYVKILFGLLALALVAALASVFVYAFAPAAVAALAAVSIKGVAIFAPLFSLFNFAGGAAVATMIIAAAAPAVATVAGFVAALGLGLVYDGVRRVVKDVVGLFTDRFKTQTSSDELVLERREEAQYENITSTSTNPYYNQHLQQTEAPQTTVVAEELPSDHHHGHGTSFYEAPQSSSVFAESSTPSYVPATSGLNG
ncbi:hypothetical protein ACFORL_04660 [Legionella dresdenensis]|uniref:Transmembrane protein n=1 Tax=Legionella dresdenensis TaxID=450200 RepID=A0ABV8CDT4_9GAMM